MESAGFFRKAGPVAEAGALSGHSPTDAAAMHLRVFRQHRATYDMKEGAAEFATRPLQETISCTGCVARATTKHM